MTGAIPDTQPPNDSNTGAKISQVWPGSEHPCSHRLPSPHQWLPLRHRWRSGPSCTEADFRCTFSHRVSYATRSLFRGEHSYHTCRPSGYRGHVGLQSTFLQRCGVPGLHEWPGLFSSKAQAGSLAPHPLPHPLQGPPFLQNAPCSALEALHTQSSMGTEDFRDGKQILHLRVKAPEAP